MNVDASIMSVAILASSWLSIATPAWCSRWQAWSKPQQSPSQELRRAMLRAPVAVEGRAQHWWQWTKPRARGLASRLWQQQKKARAQVLSEDVSGAGIAMSRLAIIVRHCGFGFGFVVDCDNALGYLL